MHLLELISRVISAAVLICYSSQMIYFIASVIKKIRKKIDNDRKN